MSRSLRLLTLLTYYTPHISGLTLYARQVNAGLVRRGHTMTVITSRYEGSLPADEIIDGAHVHRCRVWVRVSKGVLMPGYLPRAFRAIREHDAVLLHIPQIESALLVIFAKLLRKPVIATYHCDLELPNGLARVLFTPLIKASHFFAVLLADKVVVSSDDYVGGSRFLRFFRRFFKHRLDVVYPPCARLAPDPSVALPVEIGPEQPLIGFVGRFAEEKGVEYIVEAIPAVLREHPDAVFAFVGEREKTFGERVYERLRPSLDRLGDRVRLLGVISEAQLTRFYERCNVLLLPSINSTEAFGMVQIEAMYHGVPVVAGDIAGVRVPISLTGMGILVPPRNAAAIAEAVLELLRDGSRYRVDPDELERTFGPERAVDYYESLLQAVAVPREANRSEEASAP